MLLFNAMPRLMERLGYGRVSWNTETFFFFFKKLFAGFRFSDCVF